MAALMVHRLGVIAVVDFQAKLWEKAGEFSRSYSICVEWIEAVAGRLRHAQRSATVLIDGKGPI